MQFTMKADIIVILFLLTVASHALGKPISQRRSTVLTKRMEIVHQKLT